MSTASSASPPSTSPNNDLSNNQAIIQALFKYYTQVATAEYYQGYNSHNNKRIKYDPEAIEARASALVSHFLQSQHYQHQHPHQGYYQHYSQYYQQHHQHQAAQNYYAYHSNNGSSTPSPNSSDVTEQEANLNTATSNNEGQQQQDPNFLHASNNPEPHSVLPN